MTMGPSSNIPSTSTSTSLRAAASTVAAYGQDDSLVETQPIVAVPRLHPEDPLIHCMPEDVYPIYRPLPAVLQVVVIFLSMWTSAFTTWKNLTWLEPLAIVKGWKTAPTSREWFLFAIKTLVFTFITKTLLQDIFLHPSRLTMTTLCEKYFLPSPLSRYEKISVLNNPTTSKINNTQLGVHYLKYQNPVHHRQELPLMSSSSHRFDAVYFNHGFGASSLSWLPAIPSLVERLGGKVGLGHDAVGFGFTDRPDGKEEDLQWYTPEGSARIGLAVLLHDLQSSCLLPAEGGEGERVKPHTNIKMPSSVALLGHSMGALATLKMALKLPREIQKFIVLSSPALGVRGPPLRSNEQIRSPTFFQRKVSSPLRSVVQKVAIFPIGGYILRRVVGSKGSWKSGLQSAWGDPNKVRDSDILRFQWPSIGAGWERGLLNFARAQKGEDDKGLLRRVLDLPNTTVAIILGSKDKVVPSESVRKFLGDDFDNVPVIELEGVGHDAFEEDVDAFLRALDEILRSRNQTKIE